MRELTKSMMRLSWTMPLFGMQQMTNLALPQDLSRPLGPVTDALNAINDTARQHIGDPMKGAIDAGDQMQDATVDMMFRLVPVEAMDPSAMMKLGMDTMQRSVEVMGRAMSWGGSGGNGGDDSGDESKQIGWGPMPSS